MSKLHDFYTSERWQKLRSNLMLERVNDNGELICEYCGKPITKAYDCIAHHVIELTDENVGDYQISLNPDNIKLIHFKCHNAIHERFDGLRQYVYIVHGAPCSGKSTFIKEHANKDDLILDLDAIYKAITLCGAHEHPQRVKANVFGIRDCIFDMIRMRKGKWRCAWITTTKTELELERERDMLGAEAIHIDTDKETCLKNLYTYPDGRDIKAWTGYIEDYFNRIGI